jgi:AcrR family transcriptional regulator
LTELAKSRPNDARARRSREALRQALLALVEEKPYEQLTIREIASKAGVSFPTFYRQFPTKEALMEDIAAEEIRALLDITLPLMDKKSVRASASAICDFVLERRTLWRTLLTTGATAALREEFITRSRQFANTHERRNPGLPVDLMAPFVVGGIFEILSWWLRQPDDVPADYVAQVLEALVIKPSMQRQNIALPASLDRPGGGEAV